MTDREKLARQWAERVKSMPEVKYPRVIAAAEYILDTTEPEMPELNQWDGVEKDGREWVVWSVSETGALELLAADGNAVAHDFAENTTPNGKRYELREVVPDEPGHPGVLVRFRDYQFAPEGTIVSGPDSDAVYLKNDLHWESTSGACPTLDLVNTERRVLRWGWGDEE